MTTGDALALDSLGISAVILGLMIFFEDMSISPNLKSLAYFCSDTVFSPIVLLKLSRLNEVSF